MPFQPWKVGDKFYADIVNNPFVKNPRVLMRIERILPSSMPRRYVLRVMADKSAFLYMDQYFRAALPDLDQGSAAFASDPAMWRICDARGIELEKWHVGSTFLAPLHHEGHLVYEAHVVHMYGEDEPTFATARVRLGNVVGTDTAGATVPSFTEVAPYAGPRTGSAYRAIQTRALSTFPDRWIMSFGRITARVTAVQAKFRALGLI